MPFAAIAAPIAGAVVSSALAPGTSGGGSGGSNMYTPTGLGAADTSWQQLLQGLQQNYGNASPWIGTTAGDALGNALRGNAQYGTGYMDQANAAGQGYGNLANTLNQQSGMNFGTQQALLGAGNQVYQTALDPQNALYNRTAQQLQDQTGATNSMYGLGSSAAGAGVANQAMSNFNIDWQNQQLQRQLAGLQGYGQAAGTAGGYGQLGTAQASAAPGAQLQAGQVPWQVNQQINTQPTNLLNQYSGALQQGIYQPGQNLQSQIIPYLNYGQGATQAAYGAASQNAGALGSMVSQGLGSAAQAGAGGWLGGLFGSSNDTLGSGSTFGGSGWSGSGGNAGYGASPVTGLNSGVGYNTGGYYGF